MRSTFLPRKPVQRPDSLRTKGPGKRADFQALPIGPAEARHLWAKLEARLPTEPPLTEVILQEPLRLWRLRFTPSRLSKGLRRSLRYRLTACVLALSMLFGIANGGFPFPKPTVFAAEPATPSELADYGWLMYEGTQADPYLIKTAAELAGVAELVRYIDSDMSSAEVTIRERNESGEVINSYPITVAGSAAAAAMESWTKGVLPSRETTEEVSSETASDSNNISSEGTVSSEELSSGTSGAESQPGPSATEETPSWNESAPQDAAQEEPIASAPQGGQDGSVLAPAAFFGSALWQLLPPSEEPSLPEEDSSLPVSSKLETASNGSTLETTASKPEASLPELDLDDGNTPILTTDAAVFLVVGEVKTVPVGFAGSYFRLSGDLDLGDFNGGSTSGGGGNKYWTPIGLLTGDFTGTPFLGDFDGAGYTIRNFCYAPASQDPSPAGYGLFGYLGDGGRVHDLTLDLNGGVWDLTSSTINKTMGGSAYSMGFLVGGSQGQLQNCVVTNGTIQYKYNGSASTSLGGLAGALQAGSAAPSLSGCAFLGSIQAVFVNGGEAQAVGGLAGIVSGSAVVEFQQCASAADFDVFNGAVGKLFGGIGGLAGMNTAALSLTECFTTGLLRASNNAGGLTGYAKAKITIQDCYSTASLGGSARNAGKGTNAPYSDEGIGGLIGYLTSDSSMTNAYYAGGLLEPQFGAVVGYNNNVNANGFKNVAVDRVQAPHAASKYSKAAIAAATDWAAFTAEPWTAASGLHDPSLTWAATSSNPVIRELSEAASRQWAALSDENAVVGSDGVRNLYRLRDGVTTLGSLVLTEPVTGAASSAPVGGLFTGEQTVGGFAVPIVRKGLYAANQTVGNSDRIDTAEAFRRFLDIANRGGGGYLGGIYHLEGTFGGTQAAPIQVPDYSNGKPFCSALQGNGETASVVRCLSFPKENSVGLFSLAVLAAFSGFTIENVQIGNTAGTIEMNNTAFGVLAGTASGISAENVTVRDASYFYHIPTTGNYGDESGGFSFLFGVGLYQSSTVTSCTVERCGAELLYPGTTSRLTARMGGMMGNVSKAAQTFSDCRVDADMKITFENTYTGNLNQNQTPTIGGIIGYNNDVMLTLDNCSVTGSFEGGNVGGLIGRAQYYTVTNSSFVGNLSTSTKMALTNDLGANSGGIVGCPQHSYVGGSKISGCVVLGNISALYSAGGLLGYAGQCAPISDSYVNAIVSSTGGAGHAGGLVGRIFNTVKPITSSYFTGQLSGATVGGIVGHIEDKLTFTAASLNTSRYDSQLVTKQTRTVGNREEIYDCGAPGSAAAAEDRWASFGSAWSYEAGDKHQYPQLKWLQTANAELSKLSTVKLFRIPDNTLDDIFPGTDISVVLPDSVTAAFQKATDSPFVQQGAAAKDDKNYTETVYRADAALGTDDLEIRYAGLGGNSTDLALPYKWNIRIFDYGSGIENDPFIIPDLETLQKFRTFVDLGFSNGVYFIVASPDTDVDGAFIYPSVTIDLSGEPDWAPIQQPFAGFLDGNQSVLKNMYSTGIQEKDTGIWTAGLFTDVSGQAWIRDISILDAVIQAPAGLGNNLNHSAGVLSARFSGAALSGIVTTGNIQSDGRVQTGGLVGSLSCENDMAFDRLVTDVAIQNPSNAGNITTGSGGGLFGYIKPYGQVAPVITLRECASYGSVSAMPLAGGLIGWIDNANLTIQISDSFSLGALIPSTSITMRQYGGGLIGYVRGNGITNGSLSLERTYYAGENRLVYNDAGSPYRIAGGLIGPMAANSTESYLLTITDSYYNHNENPFAPWVKERSGYTPVEDIYASASTTFSMSQPAGSTEQAMSKWDTAAWSFADGLYPSFSWESADGWLPEYATLQRTNALTLRHIAVHRTRAEGEPNTNANLFVRYPGAALSTTEPNFRQTVNQKMLVAKDNGSAAADIRLAWNGLSRSLTAIPGVEATGQSDASSFYINPDGMWESGKTEWGLYTADALAGLAAVVNQSGKDANGIPTGSGASDFGAADTIAVERDLELAAYPSWVPIGNTSHGFAARFEGKGHVLRGLSLRETAGPYAGLFGVIDGGTACDLALVSGGAADSGDAPRSGIQVGSSQIAAGGLAGLLKNNGGLQNCLVSLPVIGVSMDHASTGGLVGRVENGSVENCAFTGYLYLAPAEGVGSAGMVGGLAGMVQDVQITASYASGYVEGGEFGALVGRIEGTNVLLTDCAFSQNAAGEAIPAVGSGAADEIANSIPTDMGNGWLPPEAAGLTPLQAVFTGNPSLDLKAVRAQLELSLHARSATTGRLAYIGGVLSASDPQPVFPGGNAGTVEIVENSFSKVSDGLVELSIRVGTGERRVLVNVRCWYDEGKAARNYTITSPYELAELAEIVNGTINTDASQVGHRHEPLYTNGNADDFSGATITLAADLELSELLTDAGTVRAWNPIGTAGNPFAGSFDGAGHAVSEMQVSGDRAGLFGNMSGTVENLLVTASAAAGPQTGLGLVGLLAAEVSPTGKIQNCGSSGQVSVPSGSSFGGGLVGRNQGLVSGCFSTAEPAKSSTGTLGGIVGDNSGTGRIQDCAFSGYCWTTGTAGGIAGSNNGTVSSSYTAAYLQGRTVYNAAPGSVSGCLYDGRFTASHDASAKRADGGALTMGSSWKSDPDGTYYPRLKSQLAFADQPLGQAASIAAARFLFIGSTNAGYSLFSSVRVPAAGLEGNRLVSDVPSILAVAGIEAQPVLNGNGEVVLRLSAMKEGAAWADHPCYLSIPSSLAISYSFNWEELIANPLVKPDPNYHTGTTTADSWTSSGSTVLLSTAGDLQAFASYVNGGGPTAGRIFRLDYDIDLGGSALPAVTTAFLGTFDGNGHVISKFIAGGPLFAEVAAGAQITMLGFRDGTVTVSGGGRLNAAAVVGVNRGRVSNVYAENCSVAVVQTNARALTVAGGLIAENTGTLEASYFLTGKSDQVNATLPEGAGENLRMGGLAGLNSGLVNGCYSAASLLCTIGDGAQTGNYQYFSWLVGQNEDDGQITFSYWRSFESIGRDTILDDSASYRRPDGAYVPGQELFMGDIEPVLTARWLSADTYGGSYYMDDSSEIRLYSFRMLPYDFTDLFGEGEIPYMMLSLQYTMTGGEDYFANGIASWQGYLFPSFANLSDVTELAFQIPMHSERIRYSLSADVIAQGESLVQPANATVAGAEGGLYAITGLGEKPARVLLQINIIPVEKGEKPWGVYRRDSTSPLI